MGQTLLTSDLHLEHERILEWGRPWDSIADMNKAVVDNINSVATEDDTLIIVGDFCMGHRAFSLEYATLINARKILVLGNHDYPHPINLQKTIDKWKDYYADFFDEMVLSLDMEIGGETVHISHFPAINNDARYWGEDDRYKNYRPEDKGLIIHGHIHSRSISIAPNHIHIGFDSDWTEYGVERYHPIPLSVVEKRIKEMQCISR